MIWIWTLGAIAYAAVAVVLYHYAWHYFDTHREAIYRDLYRQHGPAVDTMTDGHMRTGVLIAAACWPLAFGRFLVGEFRRRRAKS
jgi:hypothetical protein